MPILDARTDDVMDLETFLAYVRANVRPGDPETVAAAAPALRALANDRDFLAERVHDELRDDCAFQRTNTHTAQTILLGTGPGFTVRANMWLPAHVDAHHREWQSRMLFYGVAHDHNFDLLTVGYHGPGYETDLYTYDRATVAGLPGEPVTLAAQGRERLGRGDVMLYRASQDVHTQHPPEAFSVSLNLVVMRPHRAEQLYFDVASGRIRGPVESAVADHGVLCEAVRHFADGRTASLLERMAAQHPSSRTRVAAIESLARLAPSDADRLWSRALESDDPRVRAEARAHFEGR